MEQTKHCKQCDRTLSIEDFHRDRARADGHKSRCKACNIARARRWTAANPERVSENGRRWRAENPERAAERDNSDRHAETTRLWRLNNMERSREKVRRANARRASVQIVGYTVEQLQARMSMFDGCWICGGPVEEVDHVKPLSKGGPHMLSNLRPICGQDNRRKRNTWPYEPPDRSV